MNVKRKKFVSECEDMIQFMYNTGCLCEYERVRNYILWDKPVDFIDHEVLFSTFSKHLEIITKNVVRCKICATTYERKLEAYSIAMQVVHVRIIEKGNYVEKGASLKSPIPVCLGFRGYDLGWLKKKYFSTDINGVIEYLKEMPNNSTTLWSRLKSIWS